MTTVLSKGWDTISSIFATLDRNTKIDPENFEGYQPGKITGHVEFHEVQFAYPARSYHLIFLRKHIALINQEPTLFAGTIRENITYGSSNNITESEILEVARAVNIHDFVISQRDGSETWCGDKGLQLSGGQN